MLADGEEVVLSTGEFDFRPDDYEYSPQAKYWFPKHVDLQAAGSFHADLRLKDLLEAQDMLKNYNPLLRFLAGKILRLKPGYFRLVSDCDLDVTRDGMTRSETGMALHEIVLFKAVAEPGAPMSQERLEALRRDMKKCVRCSLCKLVPMPTIQQTQFTSACPPVDEYHFHAYSGGGMQVMALAVLDGRIQVDEDLPQIVSACTTCGMCDVSCKFIMAAERMDVIIALKEHLGGVGLRCPAKTEEQPTLAFWADGLDVKTLPESQAEVLLYVGAGARHDPQHAATAPKLAQLLQAPASISASVGDEPESGIEAYWTGHRHIFAAQARTGGRAAGCHRAHAPSSPCAGKTWACCAPSTRVTPARPGPRCCTPASSCCR